MNLLTQSQIHWYRSHSPFRNDSTNCKFETPQHVTELNFIRPLLLLKEHTNETNSNNSYWEEEPVFTAQLLKGQKYVLY